LQVGSRAEDVYLGGNPPIQSWSAAEQGAGLQNWGMVRAPSGLLYVANNAAILEFDGETWRTFSLPNKFGVIAIALGLDGRVYVGGPGDFGYMESDQRGVSHFFSLLEGRFHGGLCLPSPTSSL